MAGASVCRTPGRFANANQRIGREDEDVTMSHPTTEIWFQINEHLAE
jgi:hypothetical protein